MDILFTVTKEELLKAVQDRIKAGRMTLSETIRYHLIKTNDTGSGKSRWLYAHLKSCPLSDEASMGMIADWFVDQGKDEVAAQIRADEIGNAIRLGKQILHSKLADEYYSTTGINSSWVVGQNKSGTYTVTMHGRRHSLADWCPVQLMDLAHEAWKANQFIHYTSAHIEVSPREYGLDPNSRYGRILRMCPERTYDKGLYVRKRTAWETESNMIQREANLAAARLNRDFSPP